MYHVQFIVSDLPVQKLAICHYSGILGLLTLVLQFPGSMPEQGVASWHRANMLLRVL